MNVPDVRNAPANTIRFVNGVPGALVRTPGQVVNLGTGAFNTVGAVGSRVPAATGTAIQVTGQTLPVSSLLHSLFELPNNPLHITIITRLTMDHYRPELTPSDKLPRPSSTSEAE